MHLRLPTALAVSLAAVLVAAAPAAAGNVRYAGPGSADITGTCASAAAACEIEHAIEGASATDEIIVLPGRYPIGTASINTPGGVTVRGLDAANRPTIVSAPPPLGGNVLEATATTTLRDLHVESNSAATAISLQNGSTGERLIGIVAGGSGDAKGIQLKDGTNVLRDSLAVSDAASGAAVQVKDGTNKVIGVTAIGTNGANGVDAKVTTGSAAIKNSILLGKLDLDVSQGSNPTISYSNWRPANSYGGVNATNNRTDIPQFCHSRGLYYPAPDSSSVNAAGADAGAGTHDVIGQPRTLLGGHDIGAYEYDGGGCPPPPATDTGDGTTGQGSTTGTGTSGTSGSPSLPAKSDPVLGSSVTLGDLKGKPRVKLPGTDRFVELTADSTVPVGSVVDASKGTVELTSVRDGSGKTQTGAFSGGVFKVRQSKRDTVTELALTGGAFGSCKAGGKGRRGKLAASRSRHSSSVRRLWGRDRGGRFRTRGRHGSATVRGTRWLTEDRCDGTLFKVAEGAVDVRDDRKRKTVRVKRGKPYLAAAPAAKKRRR